ncbi:hypothetical protein Tco_1109973 [Tanacetum coccineum]|uniref:Uncharacterized protein n=1 Tax=Tanacetum coccineum TaxID=301880 RepID=A0ABQ5IIY0_9ASTR
MQAVNPKSLHSDNAHLVASMGGRNEHETANQPERNITPMQTSSFANIVNGETPTSDGLSIITSKLGTPMLLDSYVNTIYEESWGRNSYAQALIELHAENEFKDSLVGVVPLSDQLVTTE